MENHALRVVIFARDETESGVFSCRKTDFRDKGGAAAFRRRAETGGKRELGGNLETREYQERAEGGRGGAGTGLSRNLLSRVRA